MTIYLDNYSDYVDWCAANNYDGDTEIDREEESYKREVLVTCYIKKLNSDEYASLSYAQDYDWGSSYFTIEEGFIRKEEQVVTTKVTYIKE